MTAAACLKKAVAAGAELYIEAGRLRGRGARPEPELAAALREREAEIVALLASRESAAPAAGPSQETVPQAVPPDTSAIDRAAEYHQRRIAAKEADLALRGLGPDGVTPLAEYQRLAAEGAKTAKAALAAGHESLSKITNTPSPTNGQWAEPVQGKLQTSEYEKDGTMRISLGVVADHVLSLRQTGRRKDEMPASREPAFDEAIPF
jgi:hypothetical protein